MARIVWLMNRRGMNGLAANDGTVQATLKIESQKIAAKASSNLAQHRREGHTQITTEHPGPGKYGHVDHYVHMEDTDSGSGEPAPYAIEFGHFNNWSKSYVPGLYILSRAAGLA